MVRFSCLLALNVETKDTKPFVLICYINQKLSFIVYRVNIIIVNVETNMTFVKVEMTL